MQAKSQLFVSPPLEETTPIGNMYVNVYHKIPAQCNQITQECIDPNTGLQGKLALGTLTANVTFYAIGSGAKPYYNLSNQYQSEPTWDLNRNMYDMSHVYFGYPGISLPKGDRFAVAVTISQGNETLDMFWGNSTYPSSVVTMGYWYPSEATYQAGSYLVLAVFPVVLVMPLVAIVIVVSRRRSRLGRAYMQ